MAPEHPGVTVVDGKATLGSGEGVVPDAFDPKAWLRAGYEDRVENEEAILPPSEAVRLEMRKMELEAQIENAGGSVMSATGDVSRDIGKLPREALAAYDAGLLDTTGTRRRDRHRQPRQGLGRGAEGLDARSGKERPGQAI